MIPLMRGSQNSQIHRDRRENSGFQGLEEGGMQSYCLLGTEFRSGKIKTF